MARRKRRIDPVSLGAGALLIYIFGHILYNQSHKRPTSERQSKTTIETKLIENNPNIPIANYFDPLAIIKMQNEYNPANTTV